MFGLMLLGVKSHRGYGHKVNIEEPSFDFSCYSRENFNTFKISKAIARKFGSISSEVSQQSGKAGDLLDAVTPITWFSVKVSHGDDNDQIVIDSVDDSVGKAG